MKTQSQTHNTDRVATKHAFMALTGIVIAIICSLVLLREVKPVDHAAEQLDVSIKTKAVVGHQVMMVTRQSIVSIMK